ncbi:MGDG synthase family glycosyltransferase [Bacillus sp. J33]|uniref:MGDG synthase family glycosyltransferase n=1 Tax=Bacillus sp. J33 TaxID=935836 RepID=UPI00047ECC9F|nr:hypothetical protein [Bacillus sp. J33]
MKKILILPFLQIPTGHHQVAEAIRSYLKELDESVEVKKVDIFHFTFPLAEKAASRLYLKALKMMPSFYRWLYRQNACRTVNYKDDKSYFLYESLFLKSMKKLINQEKPDIIVCTHCLPSYLLNVLKKREQISISVINIYTDYFINTVWGTSHIDLHFVPSHTMKNFLKHCNVNSEKIIVTGIPVHPQITKKKEETYKQSPSPFHVLVSGGNLGVGSIEKIFRNNKYSGQIKYFVLCGKNQNLFQRIDQLKSPYLVPISYISSREEMNNLYEKMDVMLTKPGGITVSECLNKKIPLCLLNALPGPEERNEQYLLEEKLAIKINPDNLEQSLLSFLKNQTERQNLQRRLSLHTDRYENIYINLKKIMEKKPI